MLSGDKAVSGKATGTKGWRLGGQGAVLYKEIGKSLPDKLTSEREHEEGGCLVAISPAEGTARPRPCNECVLGSLEAR